MSSDPILARKTLGPYSVTRKLGEGGMGAVYLGYHRVLQVQHALKVVHPRMTSDTQLIERFNREARNAARLVHPNIVQVITADVVDGVYYIAMQYVEGATLANSRRKDIPAHQAVRWIHMVAKALDYAHSRNVIHRDVKPGNIMIDQDDNAKLMDFGLVREIEPSAQDGEGQPLTGAGLMVGTPQYMPPEQWNGEADPRSDLFALGVTLYNVLTGEHPFGGRSMAEIFRNVVQGRATSIRTRLPDLDPELAAIIEKATQIEPDARFQSGREFAAALENWWQGHPPTEAGARLDRSEVAAAHAGTLGTPGQGGSAVARTRSGPRTRSTAVDTPTNQGQAPTLARAAAPGRASKRLLTAGGIGLGIAIAAGVFGFSGWSGGGRGSADGIAVRIPVDQATETRPLRTAQRTFSVPGESGGASVLLNGSAYEFGSAVPLAPGANRLEIATGTGADKVLVRVLFVHCDVDSPSLEVPALASARDGEIRIEAQSWPLEGTVRDDDPEVRVDLIVAGQPARAVSVTAGRFTDLVPVADQPVAVEITAVDRAGNASAPLKALLVPDREPLALHWSDEAQPVTWFGSRLVVLRGKASKLAGVRVQALGQALALAADGTFALSLDRDPGVHAVTIEAQDAFGRTARLDRELTIDLVAPTFLELKPESGGAIEVESLPAEVALAGKLDGIPVRLAIGGTAVAVAADGSFRYDLPVAAHGEVQVELIATDPAERVTRQQWKSVVKPRRYRRLDKPNAQGAVEFVRLIDEMVMVAIPGGEFALGAAEGLPDAPQRPTRLTPYLIGKYEVTVEQYARFLQAEGLKPEELAARQWLMPNPPHLEYAGAWTATAGSERLPVVGVTWAGARAYAKWADPESGGLPSEAQWEYAARGGEGRTYPWGNDPPNSNRCNFDGAGFDEAQGVDSCAAGVSPFGVMNLAGNVEEWCLDWYDVSGYTRLAAENPATEAKPAGADRRVVRGGSYLTRYQRRPEVGKADAPCDLSAAFRGHRLPATGAIDRGFRCAGSRWP